MLKQGYHARFSCYTFFSLCHIGAVVFFLLDMFQSKQKTNNQKSNFTQTKSLRKNLLGLIYRSIERGSCTTWDSNLFGLFSCLSFINHVIMNAYYTIISFFFLLLSSFHSCFRAAHFAYCAVYSMYRNMLAKVRISCTMKRSKSELL